MTSKGPLRDLVELLDLQGGVTNEDQMRMSRRLAVSIHGALVLLTDGTVIKAKRKGLHTFYSRAKVEFADAKVQAPLDVSDPRITTATSACIALLMAQPEAEP